MLDFKHENWAYHIHFEYAHNYAQKWPSDVRKCEFQYGSHHHDELCWIRSLPQNVFQDLTNGLSVKFGANRIRTKFDTDTENKVPGQFLPSELVSNKIQDGGGRHIENHIFWP